MYVLKRIDHFFKYFRQKNGEKYAVLFKTQLFLRNLDNNIGIFRKRPHFPPKINKTYEKGIITLTPGDWRN
jgi:hypothetical protein